MCGCGTDQRDSDRWLVDLNEERDLMDETAFTSRRTQALDPGGLQRQVATA